jgi:hypothetical protein
MFDDKKEEINKDDRVPAPNQGECMDRTYDFLLRHHGTDRYFCNLDTNLIKCKLECATAAYQSQQELTIAHSMEVDANSQVLTPTGYEARLAILRLLLEHARLSD